MSLPQEIETNQACRCVSDWERGLSTILLWSSPVILIVTWVGSATFGKTLLFLYPAASPAGFISSKLGLVAGILAALSIVLYWATLRTARIERANRLPGLSPLLCLLGLGLGGLLLQFPKSHWVFQESVKARTPQLEFSRNIIFMQQKLFTEAPIEITPAPLSKVGLVGSSQINLGIDVEQLETWSGEGAVHKYCLPGMVPLQYQALSAPLAEKRLDVVVCWLSEFDFFRERELPTSRLRWCAETANVRDVFSVLTPNQAWFNRGHLADLATAVVTPLWSQREPIQMLSFRFWWRFDVGAPVASDEEQQVGARLADLDQGVKNAKQNIQRTPLVDANFQAFERFARRLTDAGTRLVIIEGESHPLTMEAYPPAFRAETREKLSELSRSVGFDFVTTDQRVQLETDDWRDAVHLNETGEAKLTNWLMNYLQESTNRLGAALPVSVPSAHPLNLPSQSF
ncbi:hypothetical protein FHS27_002093 [Rhodopirellula rubra]|uniref:Uncharacterized protein n=1 Tax=Aporhodopirellula rubra TaxID=980271 RepID=A0A7W5DXY5_9BACT|nr:hypothetical protein [Aporhodopirellula rubra]MBB3206284.1 hypothetical protein [Aporhodopirellula rubra]